MPNNKTKNKNKNLNPQKRARDMKTSRIKPPKPAKSKDQTNRSN